VSDGFNCQEAEDRKEMFNELLRLLRARNQVLLKYLGQNGFEKVT
jgi:hypothetical protein